MHACTYAESQNVICASRGHFVAGSAMNCHFACPGPSQAKRAADRYKQYTQVEASLTNGNTCFAKNMSNQDVPVSMHAGLTEPLDKSRAMLHALTRATCVIMVERVGSQAHALTHAD